jgi:uncharacterized membrane protein
MPTEMPARSLYHRSVGWHAPAMRRAVIVVAIGLVVTVVLLPLVAWELAVIGGWDAAAATFLVTVWPIIARADSTQVAHLSAREDEGRADAAVLLVAAGVASLLGAGFALALAGRSDGAARLLLIGAAVLTVTLSWTLINTVYTLRYAHLHYASGSGGVDFGEGNADYRDFAYLAFTIGMTYQVSDTTVRDRRIRRTVLSHAFVSYLFGVVIVAGTVSLIAGLLP